MKHINEILSNTRLAWRLFVLPLPCKEYQGNIHRLGYGQVYYDGRNRLVHRITYVEFVGLIPQDKVLDHICQNRCCCEPSHLRVVTQRENVHAGIAPAAQNVRKTRCKRGHPLNGDNLFTRPNGDRVCRKCKRMKDQESEERIRIQRTKLPKQPRPLKMHCLRGHPLSGENLYIQPDGSRICKICSRAKVQAYRARKKEQG